MATRDVLPLLTLGLQEAYDFLGKTNPAVGKSLFNTKPTQSGYQLVQHFTDDGVLPQLRDFGGDIAETSIETSWGKKYLISMYGLKDVVASEIIRRDNYGMLTKWCTGRGGAIAEIYGTHDELLAANYFCSQFSTTTPAPGSPDGVGLFSLVHPQSPSNLTSLQANRPSVAMPYGMAALQAARANMEQQRKANGLTRFNNNIKKVVFNPNIEEIVLQTLHSDWVPGTSDRDMNTMKNRGIEPVSWKYWTCSGATNANAYNAFFFLGEFTFLDWFVLTDVQFKQQEILGINSVMFASFQEQTMGHSWWPGTFGSPGT